MDRRFADFGNSDNESVLTDAGRAGRYTCLLMVHWKSCTLTLSNFAWYLSGTQTKPSRTIESMTFPLEH
jgi:hypothetical protein